MQIKVFSEAETRKTIYPDVYGNLKLPEKKRFGIVIKRKHKIELRRLALDQDGNFDSAKYAKATVDKLINPPELVFPDGNKRDMTIDDLFELEQFDDVVDMVFIESTKLQNYDGNGEEIKN